MRIAERYGQCPFAWFSSLSAGRQTLLLRQELVRRQEEAAARAG